jgi:hypothetical protein
MLSVLTEIAEHFAGDADARFLGRGKSAPTRLFLIAMLAWNASLQPAERRDAYLDNAIGSFPLRNPDKLRRLARRMIEHKDAHYRDDRRLIRGCALILDEGGLEFRVRHVKAS